jgi:hypothetical protein
MGGLPRAVRAEQVKHLAIRHLELRLAAAGGAFLRYTLASSSTTHVSHVLTPYSS